MSLRIKMWTRLLAATAILIIIIIPPPVLAVMLGEMICNPLDATDIYGRRCDAVCACPDYTGRAAGTIDCPVPWVSCTSLCICVYRATTSVQDSNSGVETVETEEEEEEETTTMTAELLKDPGLIGKVECEPPAATGGAGRERCDSICTCPEFDGEPVTPNCPPDARTCEERCACVVPSSGTDASLDAARGLCKLRGGGGGTGEGPS